MRKTNQSIQIKIRKDRKRNMEMVEQAKLQSNILIWEI